MWPIAHVPHCPCAPSPMCPILQGTPSLSLILTMIPLCPCVPLPICPVADMSKKMSSCQQDVKLSKRCQVVKKMSNVKKSNTWTMEEVHKKISWQWGSHILMSILMSHMMVTKNPQNVHRKCFWTILVTFIFDIKIDVNMCEPHYVNLFFSLWTSSIVCVFDFLTFDSFWHFDIFLTFWHLFDILTSFWHFDIFLKPLQPVRGLFLKKNKGNISKFGHGVEFRKFNSPFHTLEGV